MWYWRHCADLRVQNGMIDCTDRQHYGISKVIHQFQFNRYCKLQSMQKHTIGCWKHNFDRILLTNTKNKILVWIYGWTHWATCWQPSQFRQVGRFPSNRTELTVRVYWHPVQPIWQWLGFDPDPDPKWWSGTVANTIQWTVINFVGAHYATQQWTALHCSIIVFLMVSLFNMSLYTTSQLCMQCLTGLTSFLLLALESILKNQLSILL